MKRTESKKKREGKSPIASEAKGLDRRTFVKLVPALGAAALTTSNLGVATALAQTPSPSATPTPTPTPVPLRVTKDMLRQAEKLIGNGTGVGVGVGDAQE